MTSEKVSFQIYPSPRRQTADFKQMTSNASTAAPGRWALLIGIDYYTQDVAVAGGTNPKAGCLEGSVKDARAAADYLSKSSAPINTTILTATTPVDRSSGLPQEVDPGLWPTFDNVKKALERIRDDAQPGDSALVHFSGHGARTKLVRNAGHGSTGHLALALFHTNGFRLMRGCTLGKYLEEIAGKGVFVTLVLDCCFSGNIFRKAGRQNSATVRSIEYDLTLGEMFADSEDEGNALSTVGAADRGVRDGNLHQDDWLVHPANYAVLSAAGPYEQAEEFSVEGHGKRGALSYFLYQALNVSRGRGLNPTHESIYQHVRILFRAWRPRQTPILYGNRNLTFFSGPTISHRPGFVAVFRPEEGGLRLDAGEAHGVCVGDEYDAYPSELQSAPRTAEAPVKLRVHAVHFLTSELKLCEDDGAHTVQDVRNGWIAELVTSLCPRKIPVMLTAAVDAIGPLSPSDAVRKCHFLDLYGAVQNDSPSCVFMLTVNDRDEYQVLDERGEEIPSLPTVPVGRPGALSHFLSIVHHVTKYKYLGGIINRAPNASFESSFLLRPTCEATSTDSFDVCHGSVWGFEVENLKQEPLYVFVFNFGPSWNITNIYEAAKKGDCLVLAPRMQRWDTANWKKKVRMRMEIPQHLLDKGEQQCEDVFKVFATNVYSPYSSFVLPKLLSNADECGRIPGPEGPETDLKDHLPDGFSDLGSGSHTRDSRVSSWAVRSFVVRTLAQAA
ncbi:caspase domain-containing protein [Cladorrhinum sp. PSN259]|nr:caspase domain-containing protein [Cladorrhinum sp. PSN259]